MKNLSLKICLVIAALFGSVGVGFASDLPKCKGSPSENVVKWHNCVGTRIYSSVSWHKPESDIYVGEWKRPSGVEYGKPNGKGIAYHSDGRSCTGKKLDGIWYNGKFQNGVTSNYQIKSDRCQNKATPVPIKKIYPLSILHEAFNKLSQENRRRVQSNLKDLGFYKFSIDGLYGEGTSSALKEYNKQYLNDLDLNKSINVEKLIDAVLKLNPKPKLKEKPEIEIEPKKEPKPKRDLEKEFELSFYGSFLHTERVPNALFFLNEIEQYDRFEFRKALRNHDIDLVVLSSPGGSVWEGLSMAGIIHDRELSTYIPKISGNGEGDCASACSFMFFAGDTRTVEGKLGVHQFYSGDGSKKEKVEEVQEGTQFTVSEIIGFLNEFETPSWVFERMFQQSEMYYFKEKELLQLETEVPDEIKENYEISEKFIGELSKAIDETKD